MISSILFSVQAGNPKRSEHHAENYDSMSEAVEKAFDFYSENATVFWNDCYFRLCYKYEISTLLDDLMLLLEMLLTETEGHEVFNWGIDTFDASWTMDWSSDWLRVTSEWKAVSGPCLSRLRSQPTIEVSKIDFVCEWRRLLTTVLEGLRHCGYTETNLPEMEKLCELLSRIPEDGIHYKASLLSKRT